MPTSILQPHEPCLTGDYLHLTEVLEALSITAERILAVGYSAELLRVGA